MVRPASSPCCSKRLTGRPSSRGAHPPCPFPPSPFPPCPFPPCPFPCVPVPAPVHVAQARLGVQHRPHLLGIVRPVRGQVPVCADPEPGGGQGGEVGVQQSPLVVPGLVPGIGKEGPELVHTPLGEQNAQTRRRVSLDQADVVDALGHQSGEDGGDGGLVDLEGEHVRLGPGGGHGDQGLAGARADFDDQRCRPAEGGRQVDRGGRMHRGRDLGPRNPEHEAVRGSGPRLGGGWVASGCCVARRT